MKLNKRSASNHRIPFSETVHHGDRGEAFKSECNKGNSFLDLHNFFESVLSEKFDDTFESVKVTLQH